MAENAKYPIKIDLNQFKLHVDIKNKIALTLHFNSPSRRFYLSLIAFVVNEMKKRGKIIPIPMEEYLDLLALLNESVGGSAGSSDKENLLPRIYRKWHLALPDLEEAPLFKVLGRRKEYDEGGGKSYQFSEAEKDNWANLFEYIGSEENVRLKFAIDKIDAGLDDVIIIYGDSLNGEAWDKFVLSLKGKVESEPTIKIAESFSEVPEVPVSPPKKQRTVLHGLHRRITLLAIVVLIVGAATWAVWKFYLKHPSFKVASLDKMAYPLPDKPSIAVLPFVNMSKDPDQEYFSDGLTEDLITDLSKISGLLVIAHSSTLNYKGKPVEIKQVAEELGVRYVLEGSVRRAGDEIRINAQLIDAMTGHHLWAERYDGTMGKIFALQDKITQKIVSALVVKLTGSERELVAQKGTDNVEAYDAFLRGWVYYLRLTPEDSVKAVASFKKAIELDPNYGRAYAGLAAVYYGASTLPSLLKGLGVSWHEARTRSIQYLKKATKGPITHYVKSQMYLWRRQHQKAISEMEQALALDPNDPANSFGMGKILTYAGRPKDAVEFFKKGMRLDPHNPFRYLLGLGIANFCMGELQEAISLVERALRLNPETFEVPVILAAYYALLGRDQEARAAIETFKKEKVDILGGFNLRAFMNNSPFKDRTVAQRFADGLRKAGIPPAKIPGGYFPAFKENQLTGEEIRSLFFGSAITGYIFYPQQFWASYEKDGEFTWRGPSNLGGPSSDSGKSRIEGDMICWQYQKKWGGVEFCGTIFRYPGGSYESKDEYFWCCDFGFSTFSLVK
jgi:adenylate cyclase